TLDAAPPLEPPDVLVGSHGLRVMPVSGLSVTPFQPYSGTVVLPIKTAPLSRRRAVIGESSASGWSGVVRDPRLVGYPFISMRSLIEVGTPSISPIGAPRRHRA